MFKKINEKGQALVMVLFCSVIAILFIMAVLYMVQRGEQSSGMEKRYETSLDAADAGVTLSVKFLDNKSLKINSSDLASFVANVDYSTPDTCLAEKLVTPCTTSGCAAAWAICPADRESLDPEQSPDIAFTVRGSSSAALYDVSAKIVDSRRGVTGSPPGNFNLGGVVNSDGVLTPVKLPYFYYIVEVAARQQNPANTAGNTGSDNRNEVARLTYVYAD